MGTPLDKLAGQYGKRFGEAVRSKDKLRDLYGRYIHRRELSLLDAAAATAAIDSVFYSDDLDAVTPQMREAFDRAYPGRDLLDRLEYFRELGPESESAKGFLGNWKGVYHEVLVRDRLNEGQQVGSIVLGEGQRAVLAGPTNQEGFDLQILNANGSVDGILQAKATDNLSPIREALEKHPDIDIVATREGAESIVDERVFSSGFDDQDLEAQVAAPTEEVLDTPLEQLAETVLPGLPFVIVVTTEGARVLMGKQAFQGALHRSVERSVKSGTAMGVGALVALAGPQFFSLPAVFLTRLGIDRVTVHRRIVRKVRQDHQALSSLAP